MIDSDSQVRYREVCRAMDIHAEAKADCSLCAAGSIPVYNDIIGWTHIDTGDAGGDSCARPDIWDKLITPAK